MLHSLDTCVNTALSHQLDWRPFVSWLMLVLPSLSPVSICSAGPARVPALLHHIIQVSKLHIVHHTEVSDMENFFVLGTPFPRTG